MPVEIGRPAPNFTLRDQQMQEFSLEQLKGKKSLLVFIPFPFSGLCSAELCTVRDRLADLNAVDANVAVITCDTVFANARWAMDEGFEFPILSDYWPHGEVTRQYGVFHEKVGAARRATFVLDGDGMVRAIVASESISMPREFDEYTEALASF